MAYRPHWFAEALSEVTAPASSTNYGDVVTLTLLAADQKPNTDYAVFWSAQGRNSSTTSDYRIRLTLNGSAVVTANKEQQEVSTPPDYDTQGGVYFYNSGATPADAAFAVQIGKETAGDTARAKNGRLCALELAAGDDLITSTGRVTTTSSTFQNTSASKAMTMATGDILIATALLDVNSTNAGDEVRLRISDGTLASFEAGMRGMKDTTTRESAMVMWQYPGSAGSKTIRVQYNADNGGATAGGISEIRLLKLSAAGFDNVYYFELSADSVGPETSYTTCASQTFTPAANDHLALAWWRFGGELNTISAYAQALDGSDVLAESIREPASTDGRYPGLVARIAAYAATSRTQAIQRKTENASSQTLVGDGAGFATFDLGVGAQTLTPGLLTNSNTFYAPTITTGSVTLTPDLFTNSNTFYGATVTQPGQVLQPGLFTNASTFYDVTVLPGAATLAAARFDNSSTFYGSSVLPQPVTLIPSRLDNVSEFYGATLTQGSISILPELFENTNTFFGGTVSPGVATLLPARFDNDNTFYPASILQAGDQTLSPSLLVNVSAFYSPIVSAGIAPATPQARIVTVSAERRAVRVGPELRFVNVPAESRGVVAMGDDRLTQAA